MLVQPVNPSVPMVAGTARDLTCTITLTNVDDINVMVNFTWVLQWDYYYHHHQESLSLAGRSLVTSLSSPPTLTSSPLDSVVDTTMFACLVSVNSDPADSFIIPTAANNSVDITVQCECYTNVIVGVLSSYPALPPPTVMTTSQWYCVSWLLHHSHMYSGSDTRR